MFDPIKAAIDGIVTTDEERDAQAARRKAASLPQTELDFAKQVWADNNATVDSLEDDIFGKSPEEIAQELANERARQGYNVDPSNGLITFGDGGSFANPAGVAGGAQSGQTKGLPEGWADPFDPERMRQTYEDSWKWRNPGGSYEDMVREVRQQNPEGRPIKQVNGRWVQVSADELKTAQANGYGTGSYESNQNAPVTEADLTVAKNRAAAQNTPGRRLAQSQGRREKAAQELKDAINGIQRVEAGDFQNDWLVDENRDYISKEARDAQKFAMNKTKGWTDVKETAEEKLMREIARRNMEQDLRAQREAQASNLRTRGAYGSGAEMAGFLGAQQELAQRRSLEEMLANANASKRAMQATDLYGRQAFDLGQQDLGAGMAQDMNSRFNSTNQQQWKQHQTKVQQEENEAEGRREATKFDATNSVEDDAGRNIDREVGWKFGISGQRTGTNTAGFQGIQAPMRQLGANFKDEALAKEAEHEANMGTF